MSRGRIKRICGLTSILVLASGNLSLHAEDSYPTQWDLTHIYADEAEWQADYDKAMDMLDTYHDLRGTLNTAEGLSQYLEFSCGGELTEIQAKLQLYAEMGSSLDGTDAQFSNMQMQMSLFYSKEIQVNAYYNDELLAIPLEERLVMFQDPLLEEWSYILEEYADPDAFAYSEETTSALAVLGTDAGRAGEVSSIVLDVDMPDPEITLPDGEVIEMNDAEYFKIVSNSSYDRELKEEALRLRMTKVLPYINTLAALLEGTVMENWAYAQVNGYESSREAALDGSDVEAEVYDLLLDAAHTGAEDYQRYLGLHEQAMGADQQYTYDLRTSVSTFAKDETSYDAAVAEVRSALSMLGEDYLAYYDELMTGGYVDVYPASNKTSGAFSSGNQAGVRPYELFNYGGSASDVSTIAHEMGHAIYTCYAQDNQPIEYSAPGIFTQEVASTTNEIIYNSYMMDHAADSEEKLFYLEQLVNLFNTTFFSQAMYAEFEDQMYSIVEAGESLNAEDLTARWADLQQIYEGDAVTEIPETAYFWAQIPHFHYNYYVYQYATSIAYAASVYEQMIGDDAEQAIEAYKSFLKAGGSEKPSELLALAGIDPLDPATYERAMTYYHGLVDQYEVLVSDIRLG